jgi:choice-of-anchor B domain-containing protein
MKSIYLTVIFYSILSFAHAQTPCEFGQAAGYACENIDFWAHVPPSEIGGASTNEVWGWTDPLDGKEYVILGRNNGVSFFTIDDPANPIQIGFLPTFSTPSLWRTFRTYQNYLFIGSEASGHGLQIFDLTRLRNPETLPATFTTDAHYSGFSRCHTLVIHEESGLLFACGTNTYSGGLHVVDISNPLAPTIAGGYSDDGYTHEAQVMTYTGPDADYQNDIIVFCYNGNAPASLTIVNATDPSDIQTVSITNYSPSAYCHQGWLTPDGRHLLMNDELDESNNLTDFTRTLIWNVEDLDDPIYEGDFLGPTEAIDHNLFNIGNLSFQSNYTAGLRLIDYTDIDNMNLQEVAFFDHFPSNDNAVFQGTWMHYPYFESGIIPISDLYNGMFLVEVNFLHLNPSLVNVNPFQSAVYEVSVSEGFEGPIQLEVLGLPDGFQASFSSNDVTAPSIVQLEITPSADAVGSYTFEVVATGTHFNYKRNASINIVVDDSFCADVDQNGVVAVGDYLIVTENYFCMGDCIGDINEDQIVDINDLILVLNDYGSPCAP